MQLISHALSHVASESSTKAPVRPQALAICSAPSWPLGAGAVHVLVQMAWLGEGLQI
jgi:hypothetical protein